jgi:hypothetical protein
LQRKFVECFAGRSSDQIDEIMQSFKISNCVPNKPLINIIRQKLLESKKVVAVN